jgi:hypothetical protein
VGSDEDVFKDGIDDAADGPGTIIVNDLGHNDLPALFLLLIHQLLNEPFNFLP